MAVKVLTVIENCPIVVNEDGSVTYVAKLAVDSDGVGPSHGDRTHQDQTTLLLPDGQSLNADVDLYIVVPPQIVQGVEPVVMGCQARVLNRVNQKVTDAVVGDVGPRSKLGEASCSVAKALGLNPSPVDGGEDAHVIEYTLWPGKPAVVGDKTYRLQPS